MVPYSGVFVVGSVKTAKEGNTFAEGQLSYEDTFGEACKLRILLELQFLRSRLKVRPM